MAITGIPPYLSPIEQSLRCTCGARYVIYMGGGVGQAEARTRERAELLKATFVDACWQPWLACSCGLVLDFAQEVTLTIQ
jgi:hypothetical protein